MKTKQLGADGDQTYALVFDSGDDVLAGLQEFANKLRLKAAHFSGIGGFSDAVLGYFDLSAKQYRRNPVPEQVEVVSLNGDIALDDGGQPMVHAHVVVGRADGSARAGHLLSAHACPTLEVILVQTPRHLQRKLDDQTGLPLIDADS